MSQQRPVKSYKAGRIEASIWRNEKEQNGKTVLLHSVRIKKQFRKDDGDYQDTDYLFPQDLPDLVLVAQDAYRYIRLRERDGSDADS